MYRKTCVTVAALAAISIPALAFGNGPFQPGRDDATYPEDAPEAWVAAGASESGTWGPMALSRDDATYPEGSVDVRIIQSLASAGPQPPGRDDATYGDGVLPSPVRIVELRVTEKGFEPAEVLLEKGEPVELLVTRLTDKTCARRLVVEGQGIDAALPLGKAVTLTLVPTRRGSIRYACATGMVAGALIVR